MNRFLVGQIGYSLNGSGRGFGSARAWLKSNSKGTGAQFPGQRIITFLEFSVRFRVRAEQALGPDQTMADAQISVGWFSGGGVGRDRKWSHDFAKTGEAYFDRSWFPDGKKLHVDVMFTFTSADYQPVVPNVSFAFRSDDFVVDGSEMYFV